MKLAELFQIVSHVKDTEDSKDVRASLNWIMVGKDKRLAFFRSQAIT